MNAPLVLRAVVRRQPMRLNSVSHRPGTKTWHNQRFTFASTPRRGKTTDSTNPSQQQQPRQNPPPQPQPLEEPIPIPNTIPPVPLPPPPPLWYQRLGPLTRLAAAYARSQRRRPYLTQFCTTLVIYLCADLSAQSIDSSSDSPSGHDIRRTARSLIIGGIASIPSYKWFMFLSHNFNYPSHLFSLAVKIGITQTFFTPVFNSYFFGMQSLLSGGSLEQVAERIRRTVPQSVVNSLKVWPAVTAFSFTFIPPEYRSVFAGVIAVGWQTYLAFLNRQAEMIAAELASGGAAVAVAE